LLSTVLIKKKNIIIAIDGHSSCGKSTLARKLAEKLNYTYIDSGAMYRAVTLYAIENELINASGFDENKLIKALPKIHIRFLKLGCNKPRTILNNIDVEEKIRSLEVSAAVSKVSAVAEIRKHLVKLQRKLSENGGVVMDGRDIGTVVFPNAELKIFLTASAEVRAKRRFKELTDNGIQVSFTEVLENVISRYYLDQSRTESPLRMADDAILLDNSDINAEETLMVALAMVDVVMNKQLDINDN